MKGKLVSTLALAALLGAWTAQAEYFTNDIEIEVIGDRSGYLPTYRADGNRHNVRRAYLEASLGEHYAIRVHNPSGERVGVVIAVDGRNIISGARSYLKRSERMYVLGPHQTATYSGWRTSRNQVNRFYFTDQSDSYAEAFGDRSALGVIAVAAFREKARYRHDYREQTYNDADHYPAPYERRRSGKGSAAAEDGAAAGDSSTASKAPSQRMEKRGSAESYRAQPGTGFGEGRYSPSRRVEFKAESRPFRKTFLKYEWRATLCERGIAPCHQARNRFWSDSWSHRYSDRGFAPRPPRRDRWRHYRKF